MDLKKIYRTQFPSDADDFEANVIMYAQALKVNPDWLWKVMYSESGLDPQIIEDVTKQGHIGLIQFGSAALSDLGTNKAELLYSNGKYYKGSKQLELVYRYYLPYAKKGLITKFTDLYLIAFYPNAGGEFGGTLKKPGTWKFPQKVTLQNKGIWRNSTIGFDDKTENISKYSFEKWAENKLNNKTKRKLKNNSSQIVSKKGNGVIFLLLTGATLYFILQ